MTIIHKLKNIVFILLISSPLIKSQNTGLWMGVGFKYDLPKKFDLECGAEARSIFTNGVQVDQYFPQIGLNYKINKHIDASVAYRFVNKREDNGYYYSRNKILLNLMTDFTMERIIFKNRIRYQSQSKSYINDEFDLIPVNYFRDKIELAFDIPRTPIEPYLSAEFFYPLNSYKINNIDEIRIATGVGFPVGKKQSVEVGLMYVKERFTENQPSFIITLASGFSL